MPNQECYCESYYRYTCPNCRESAAVRLGRNEPQYKCDIVAECEPCIGCDNLTLVTDGVWEGDDDG